ncbi:phosphatidylglycerophosphatase A [bacterium]|nr:phosphatidylglycerophosphatase A [bacterium]
MTNLTDRLSLAAATALGIGYCPKMPGSAGTLAGMALWWACSWAPRPWLVQLCVLAAVMCVGIWTGTRVERLRHATDPQYVVIDEVAGALITFLFVTPGWSAAAVGLGLNRLFDIWKPLYINRLQKLPGGWGIMADDVAAGLTSWLCLQAFLRLG